MMLPIFFKIYLFICRDWGRGGERKGEKHQCVVASLVPPTAGSGPQPRPWLRVKLATLWFTGWHSIHWATPARAQLKKCYAYNSISYGHMFLPLYHQGLKSVSTPPPIELGKAIVTTLIKTMQMCFCVIFWGWVITRNTGSAWLSWENGLGILELQYKKSSHLEATMLEKPHREAT